MNQHTHNPRTSGSIPENYQRYFVPSIGGPVAEDLLAHAGLRPGERVLDVACGTGVVTRLAAEQTGAATGLDVNPGMLAVARAETPSHLSVDWHEASAESMPFTDQSFDVVLCQMGLQFFPGKLAALREMRRVLKTGGRILITVPGPKPAPFADFTDALARDISPEAASFGDLVFSMHDADEIAELLRSAGFREVNVQAEPKSLHVPPPVDFLWQYVHSTPLAMTVGQASDSQRDALERDVSEKWQRFVTNGSMTFEVGMTTATATK
jgi:ubiquinone/menaquinone biosynthesis C-methylase UbiE